MRQRDEEVLAHITDYCDNIMQYADAAGGTYEAFMSDTMAQHSIAFCILQIGELVGKLSDELKTRTKQEIDWPAVKGMRNIVVHNYGAVSMSVVWSVATEDIPVLKAFCEKQLDGEG